MSRLTDSQVVTISEGAVLARAHPGVLSDFERELFAEIAERFLQFGRTTIITPAEWLAFSGAVEGLRKAEQRAADLDCVLERAAFLARTRAA